MASHQPASLPIPFRERLARQGIYIAPGYCFHPQALELVQGFLIPKVLGKPFALGYIDEVDIYSYDPEQLPIDITGGSERWAYFFVHMVRHPNGMGVDRRTPGGHWKATGPETPMKDEKGEVIAFHRHLAFSRAKRTQWMMDEYRLNSELDRLRNPNDPSKTDSYVVCKIYTEDPGLMWSMMPRDSGEQSPVRGA